MNLIFSSFRKDIRFSNQEETDGGLDDFQDSKILLRAMREEKAITSDWIGLDWMDVWFVYGYTKDGNEGTQV